MVTCTYVHVYYTPKHTTQADPICTYGGYLWWLDGSFPRKEKCVLFLHLSQEIEWGKYISEPQGMVMVLNKPVSLSHLL